MSELPSRETIGKYLDGWTPPIEDTPFGQTLRSYAEGRLVDREAIDYEAALAVARELWTVEPVWDESSFDLVFVAAIGDTKDE